MRGVDTMNEKDTRIESAAPEIGITPEMIEAGEEVILESVGGYDLGGLFSAAFLAKKVFLAMCAAG